MAGDTERCRSLKEALFEALAAVLSNEHGIRAAGEEQMKTLEVTEGNITSECSRFFLSNFLSAKTPAQNLAL